MRVIDAARRGRIRLVPEPQGGMMIEGRRRDVATIAGAVKKRERRNEKRRMNHISETGDFCEPPADFRFSDTPPKIGRPDENWLTLNDITKRRTDERI